MVEIEFEYNQTKTNIQANLNENLQDALDKFCQKSLMDPNSLGYVKDGFPINPEKSIESHMNDKDKQTKIIHIFVNSKIKDEKNKEEILIKSKDIICPQCKEPCRISMENYRIKLFECSNGHISKDIKIIDFDDTQKINEAKIVCERCNIKNKGNSPNNEFFRCFSCKQNFCPLCKPYHDPKHKIKNYDQLNYLCQTHNTQLTKYCNKCKKNICFACVEHKDHETIYLDNFMPIVEEKEKILNEMKACIDGINATIKEVIDKLNKFSEYINKFYEINNGIFENYGVEKMNFQVLNNLNEINNDNKIFEALKKINGNNNEKDKINKMLNLYNYMNDEIIESTIPIKKEENI